MKQGMSSSTIAHQIRFVVVVVGYTGTETEGGPFCIRGQTPAVAAWPPHSLRGNEGSLLCGHCF